MTTPLPAPADLRDRARRVRLACFDVDGTLTDGRLVYDSAGGESKSFHVHDGQGLVLLRRAGIEVALVTARTSAVVERRAAELGLRVSQGIGDKLACVEALARELHIGMDDVAVMGDDLPDLNVMRHVGLSACPSDAHAWLVPHAQWRAQQPGGHGAARAFCDFLLEAQGHADGLLAGLLAARPVEMGARA
jgi:3-deoxy-D-manno-octulosonate 8-phosphate phosphatase (KDO 8-P phosphatase)